MKKYIKGIAAALIVLVLFNVIAFVIPFTRTMTFWVGYGFAIVSIILLILVCFSTNSAGKELKSRFLGCPIIYIATCHLTVQIIASLAFMAFPGIPTWISIVLSVIFLCIVLLGTIATSVAIDEIKMIDNYIQQKNFYIKSLSANMELLVAQCTDLQLKKEINNVCEAIKYSEPMSHPSLADVEYQIKVECSNLESALANGQLENANMLCKRILQIIQQRNRQCRLLK